MLDEGLLARAVPGVLAADLGHGHVALVDHDQEVLREVVEQGVGPLAGRAAVEVGRVVLDARAHAGLLEHLEVVLGARAQPLGLEELALAPRSSRDWSCSSVLDRADRPGAAVSAPVA